MSNTSEILERGKRVLIQNYARQPVVMARGEGAHLWDADGKRYLDLFAGFGGAILGHCHPALVAAAFADAFERGRYARRLRYAGPAAAPLSEVDQGWARGVAAASNR